MKKRKFISLLLAGVLASSLALSACKSGDSGNSNGNNGGGNSSGSNNNPAVTKPEDFVIKDGPTANDFKPLQFEGTLHEVNVRESSRPFAQNGQTNYKIAVGWSEANKAANVLASRLSDATGVGFTFVDVPTSLSSSDKLILIACDQLFSDNGFTIEDKDLRSSGYSIQSKYDSVFLQANTARGYQMAILAFLREVVGYDMISEDTVIYEKDGKTLPDMDIVERPDFEYRNFTNNQSRSNDDLIYGMGFDGPSDIFLYPNGAAMHNVFEVLPPEKHKEDHPSWFGTDGHQLCYTAGNYSELEFRRNSFDKDVRYTAEHPQNGGESDEDYAARIEEEFNAAIKTLKKNADAYADYVEQRDAEYDDYVAELNDSGTFDAYETDVKQRFADFRESEYRAMVAEVYRVSKECIENSPGLSNLPITQEDTTGNCTCEECMKVAIRYGVPGAEGDVTPVISATILHFMNDLDDLLQADLKAGNIAGRSKDDVIHIWFFAYHTTLTPPNTPEDVNDDDLRYITANQDIGVILAPIYAKFTSPLTDEINNSQTDAMEKWSNIAHNTMTWIYECNFHNYMYPYNSFENLIENYRYCYKVRSMIMYNQGIRQNRVSTAFVRFREYLASKAQFDLRVNYKDVRDKFFKYYFREAADTMLQLFNQEMSYVTYLEDTNIELNGGIYEAIGEAKYWPYGTLLQWETMTKQAYNEIADYRVSDPELYRALEDHINIESIFPRYVLLKFYGANYETEELVNLRKQFKADCDKFEITDDKEAAGGGTLKALWATWGLD